MGKSKVSGNCLQQKPGLLRTEILVQQEFQACIARASGVGEQGRRINGFAVSAQPNGLVELRTSLPDSRRLLYEEKILSGCPQTCRIWVIIYCGTFCSGFQLTAIQIVQRVKILLSPYQKT